MEIHKPKSVENWRDFAKEIGIIVLGVLIALAAEQAVEALHWAHEVDHQQRSLIDEAKDNLGSVARRKAQQPCIDRRLAEIHELLVRHARHQPLGVIGNFAKPTFAGSSRGAWEIALAGQALPHMALVDRIKYSNAFSVFSVWNDLTNTEQAIWARLSTISDADLFNDSDWAALRTAYAEASDINEKRRNFADYILTQVGSGSLGLAASPVASNTTYAALDRQICQPYITS